MDTTIKVGHRCNDHASIELRFEPNNCLVGLVRDFVSRFYEHMLHDADASGRMTVATHELLENGTRYSADGSTAVRIDVSKKTDSFNVSICTRNRTAPAHVNAVREAFDEMGRIDPQAYYQSLMRRTLLRVDGSGLGLGRIRAEADMVLRYTVEDDWLTIWAEAEIKERSHDVTGSG